MPSTRRRTPNLVALSPATVHIVNTITAAGGHPYLVGGSVRDALAHPGTTPKDVDLEVFGLDLDALVAALGQVGPVDEVGRSFAVLKMRAAGQDFDISLPRREVKTTTGHRGFDVTPDPFATLEDASARRDFTMNAMLYDPVTHLLVDPWGGQADLAAGVLRHTSPAFVQDPLRVLRAAGFAARFALTLDPQTAALCQSLAPTFAELSTERVWVEWEKIASRGTRVSAALAVLTSTGWLTHFPELAALAGVPQDPYWHPEGDVLTHVGLAADRAAALADEVGLVGSARAVVVLAALLHDTGKATTTVVGSGPDGVSRVRSYGHETQGAHDAARFLTRIGAPRAIIEQVVPLVAAHMVVASCDVPTPTAVRRLARRLAPATIAQWSIVVAADQHARPSGPGPGPWVDLAGDLGAVHGAPAGILRGQDLIGAGLSPGPHFGPILRAARDAQDAGAFTDPTGARAWLSQHLATTS